jgi:formate transporter
MSKPTLSDADKYHLVDAHSPPETHHLLAEAGVAKSQLPWIDLILKSLLGGAFIALGAAFDMTVAGGSPGLRASNPALVTMISAFLFPVGFTFIILTNTELATSNFFTMMFSTLQRRTTIYDLARNWITSYIFNLAGALFYAGILTWWSDTLSTDAQSTYAVAQAEARVNVNWAYNFTRGIGCNWLVGLAMYLATSGRDNTSKIYGLWIPIWAFVGLGYQHSIANFYLVPVGMFYGTNFGVGKFIWNCVIPVTLGNIVGGAFFCGCLFWLLYGREPTLVNEAGTQLGGDKRPGRNHHGAASLPDGQTNGQQHRGDDSV